MRRGLLFLMLATGLPVFAQDGPAYTLHAQSNLTLVDVTAVDHKTFIPDLTLTRDDVQILDNGKAVPTVSFDQGRGEGARPIALWLVLQCSMKDWSDDGSGFLARKGKLFAPGLAHLAPEDTVGVAHWCDDGTALIDLRPAPNAPGVEEAMDAVLEHKQPLNHGKSRSGELAFQSLLDHINAVSRQTTPRPLPVMLFLHGDRTGAPTDEVETHIERVLENSGLAFVLNNGRARDPHFSTEYLRSNTGHILQAIAYATGGALIEVGSGQSEADGYSAALAAILDRLHGRYQIGFVPQLLDGSVHRIQVRLTPEAKQSHPGLLLRSRSIYRAPLPAGVR